MTAAMGHGRPRVILCADDYAFTPGVSRGIRDLISAGRISATSVMAASRHWPAEAPALKAIADRADIGLHVTITDQHPIGAMPGFAPDGRFPRMADVFKAGLARRLPLAEIEAEMGRQAESFVRHFGRPPSHIDGHHHIQQLPGVRDAIVRLAASFTGAGIYVRSGAESVGMIRRRGVAGAKAMLIGVLGRGTRARAKAAGVGVNDGFSGAYDLAGEGRPMGELFRRFLVGARENHLIMCHPGFNDAELASLDMFTDGRERELTYLMSAAWPQLLDEMGVELGPYRWPAARTA